MSIHKAFSWTSKPEGSRVLIFAVLILGFGIIVVAKLAPYWKVPNRTAVYNPVQTIPTTPKEVVDSLSPPLIRKGNPSESGSTTSLTFASKRNRNAPSVIDRPLFDGQSVVLKVRSLNAFTTKDPTAPIEATVISPVVNSTNDQIDFSPIIGGKIVGLGSGNISTKRLNIAFTELVNREGKSFSVRAQAIHPETLSAGIEADYSSGLPLRLLGVAIDRTIMAADQIGMAYLFSSLGPDGPGAAEFKKAAMDTNQQASQNIAAEATKDLRDTPAEISLPSGSIFHVRIRSDQGSIAGQGVRHE